MSAVHPLHSICPYFAMFPPEFVERYVLAFTEPSEIVFDPFSGRGTTIFESLLLGRQAFGVDINPVAACVSGAKADPPLPHKVRRRILQLRDEYLTRLQIELPTEPFFQHCFSPKTLRQICMLRGALNWTSSKVDRFIAAMALGCLHGESHKTANCFSNRMPRTISTKPNYSINWWQKNGYIAPNRDVFEILLNQLTFRYHKGIPGRTGTGKLGDARNSSKLFRHLKGRVRLMVTSPPYLDTTDYGEDQWLRLWFLGGASRPKGGLFPDGRHDSSEEYWSFLREVWAGQSAMLTDNSVIVIRIGGRRFQVCEIRRQLVNGLNAGLVDFKVELAESPRSSEIKNRQTNVFRPGTTGMRQEHDFVFRVRRR